MTGNVSGINININNYLYYFDIPITPHASLAPAFPVFNDSKLFPLPKSSLSLWTITLLPIIEFLLHLLRFNTFDDTILVPLVVGLILKIFPKSPLCFILLFCPYNIFYGLKCGQRFTSFC